jgi:hypothetical protein
MDPVSGDVFGVPWYVDETGLRHVAIVYLNCGTIHDCSASLLRGLLSGFRSPWKVHHDMNPMELGTMLMAHISDPSTDSRAFAINELGIPEKVIDVLVARKLLGWAFAKSGI